MAMGKNNKEDEFDFWNDHSLEFLETAMKRDYQETVLSCDGYGKSVRQGCGDTIEFFLMRKNDQLDAISYDLKGCLFSHACANTIIMMARNKSVKDAHAITTQDIILYLKTLPKTETHCADHALDAFKAALSTLDQT